MCVLQIWRRPGLGQQRPVHVFHFVASGAIEQGMLDLLKFKKSLFAGVLDGGQDEVFMGGTRLKPFMELEGLVAARSDAADGTLGFVCTSRAAFRTDH
jgi:hypothetical protein